jgi:hypothetical protein
MSPSPTPGRRSERRYNDDEVRRLLQRASELESRGTSLTPGEEGPTLKDLEIIAAEAGMDPALLRQAAREMDSSPGGHLPASSAGSLFLGAPHVLEFERTVPGEVSSSLLEGLVPAIQGAAGGAGQPSLMGRTLTWHSTDPQRVRVLQVSVSVRRGETRISVQERYGNLAGALFGGIMGGVGGGVGMGVGMGVGLGALGSVVFAALFPPAVIGGSYLLARSIFRRTVQGRMRDLARLVDELVVAVEDGLEEERPRLGAGE